MQGERPPDGEVRAALRAAFAAAIDAVQGERVLRRHLRLLDGAIAFERDGRSSVLPLEPGGRGRLRVIGAGKAVAAMARGVEAVLGSELADGLIAVKHGHGAPLERIELMQAGHPVPDASSERAAARVLEFVAGSTPADRYLVLLSGGASALLAAPAAGLTLGDKQQATLLLVNSGAAIEEVNTVRRHLSRIKGGGLALAMAPARALTLAISDVPGDLPTAIGSGPTVADPSTFADAWAIVERHGLGTRLPGAVRERLLAGRAGRLPETPKADGVIELQSAHRIIASAGDAVRAVREYARAAGWECVVHDALMQGATHARAHDFAARVRNLAGDGGRTRPLLLVAAGETTLEVRGSGKGGRNQEFALVCALALAGVGNAVLLSAGTDGTDGPTDAAGAFADGASLQRAHDADLDAAACLADNDSYRLFAATGDSFVTGPTGTNVMDMVLALVY
jgi:glycerate-2-kinase